MQRRLTEEDPHRAKMLQEELAYSQRTIIPNEAAKELQTQLGMDATCTSPSHRPHRNSPARSPGSPGKVPASDDDDEYAIIEGTAELLPGGVGSVVREEDGLRRRHVKNSDSSQHVTEANGEES